MPDDHVDDFLEDMSRKLNNEYAYERPHPPTEEERAEAAKLKGAEMAQAQAEAEAEARKELVERVAGGQVISTTLFFLDNDPHVQRFYCKFDHLLGAVTSFQNVIVFRFGKLAKCLVCGDERKIPDYEPIGDEPPDLLAALAAAREKRHGEAEA
jgi:hypothetical protein